MGVSALLIDNVPRFQSPLDNPETRQALKKNCGVTPLSYIPSKSPEKKLRRVYAYTHSLSSPKLHIVTTLHANVETYDGIKNLTDKQTAIRETVRKRGSRRSMKTETESTCAALTFIRLGTRRDRRRNGIGSSRARSFVVTVTNTRYEQKLSGNKVIEQVAMSRSRRDLIVQRTVPTR